MGSTVSTDIALVRRMLAGDEGAFESFFETYFSSLFRFALVRLRDDAEAAEEVAQATLVAAVRKLDTYRGEAPLFSWLCTFCRHEIHAFCRRNPKRAELVVAGADGNLDFDSALDLLASESEGQPEQIAQRKELGDLVRKTLATLPPHYGNALSWKYMDGLSVVEIAERLKLSAKAAESLLTRARDEFRRVFERLCRGDADTEMSWETE